MQNKNITLQNAKLNKFELFGWISLVVTFMTILFICTMLIFGANKNNEKVLISATIDQLNDAISGGCITAGCMGRLG